MSRAIRVFLNRDLLIGLVVAVVASVAIVPVIAHRLRITRPAAYLGVLSAMLIVSFTIFERVEGLSIAFDVGRAVTWWTTQRASVIDVARTEPGWWLNVALFIPAAIVWSSITRRPVAAAGVLAGFSFAIESAQGLTGLGASDFTDLVANTLGGVVGAGLVYGVLKIAPAVIPDVRRPDVSADGVRLDVRWMILATVATALVVGLGLLGVQRILGSRQSALRSELEETFEGMTLDDVNEVRALDPINGRQFFDLVSVRPDSYLFIEGSPEPVEVRYPVDFLGLYRCVFVTFSDAAPAFADGAGRECTEDRYEDNERGRTSVAPAD
jgi:hypothetical protein